MQIETNKCSIIFTGGNVVSDEIVFYLYQDRTELCGETFPAGTLTADLLNLSPEDYAPMHERIENITKLENTFEETGEISLWLDLNEELSSLSKQLRRYTVFTFLLKENDDVFSAVRTAGQRAHPTILEKSEPISEEERKQTTECGRQLLSLNFVDEVPERILPYEPTGPIRIERYIDSKWLFANGFSRFAWDFYKKLIAHYRSYLHDVRAFNGTIRNFIKFALSRLRHNNPENYAEALYAFYTDERTTKKLIVNPIYDNGDVVAANQNNMVIVCLQPARLCLTEGLAGGGHVNRMDPLPCLIADMLPASV